MKFKFRLERDIGVCIHNFFLRLEPISSNASEHNNKAFLTRTNIGGISRFFYFHQMMECGPALCDQNIVEMTVVRTRISHAEDQYCSGRFAWLMMQHLSAPRQQKLLTQLLTSLRCCLQRTDQILPASSCQSSLGCWCLECVNV